MDKINLKKLRELAENTPNEMWGWTFGDPDFIASANPETVLALIYEIEDLRAQLSKTH